MDKSNNQGQPEAGAKDAFGQPVQKEEIIPEVPGENKQEQKKEDFDPTKDPRVIALLKERDDKIEEQAGHISGQGKAIREINRKLKALGHKEAGAGDDTFEPPHKEIKRSKDLTESERDEMTQREIQQMDELAALKDRENRAAEAAHKAKLEAAKKKDGEDDDEEEEDEKARKDASDPKTLIEAEIATLSGGDAEKKRELREAAKLISFDGLKTKEEIAARLKLAAEKFIPKWTPPKEQVSPAGNGAKPVEGGGAAADDPHDVMKYIKQAKQSNRGNFSL